jgi:transcriptional regulator with XRE-family HTH domain
MEPTFGERLTSWLKFVGMRQADLARALKLSKAAVSGWMSETEPAMPTVDRLVSIVKALGIPGGVAEFYARMPSEEAKGVPDDDEDLPSHPGTGDITRELDAAAIERALAGRKGEAA